MFREAAAYSLGHLGLASPDVLAALIGALHPQSKTDRDADVREAAACSLGWLGNADQDVINALVQTLDDEDAEVRTAAAGSLGLIGSATPTVIDALLTSWQTTEILEPLVRLPSVSVISMSATLRSCRSFWLR